MKRHFENLNSFIVMTECSGDIENVPELPAGHDDRTGECLAYGLWWKMRCLASLRVGLGGSLLLSHRSVAPES